MAQDGLLSGLVIASQQPSFRKGKAIFLYLKCDGQLIKQQWQSPPHITLPGRTSAHRNCLAPVSDLGIALDSW
jgi:hypothetical protein